MFHYHQVNHLTLIFPPCKNYFISIPWIGWPQKRDLLNFFLPHYLFSPHIHFFSALRGVSLASTQKRPAHTFDSQALKSLECWFLISLHTYLRYLTMSLIFDFRSTQISLVKINLPLTLSWLTVNLKKKKKSLHPLFPLFLAPSNRVSALTIHIILPFQVIPILATPTMVFNFVSIPQCYPLSLLFLYS